MVMGNRIISSGLAVLAAVAVAMTVSSCADGARDAVADVLVPSSVAGTRLLGTPGAMADAVIGERAYSAWARDTMYVEAEQAFATHEDDRIHGWQNEYWGKTMLCFSGAVAYTGDDELKEWVLDKAHRFIADYQLPNGYLSTYSNEDDIGEEGQWFFNIWGRKYTFWALVDLYESAGDEACLKAAVGMADHLIGQLERLGKEIGETGTWNGLSSSSILRPMNELYRLTGDARYLEFSRGLVEAFDRLPAKEKTLLSNAFREDPIYEWYPDQTYWAKSYETMSCIEGLADYYRLTGDRHVLDGVLAFYKHLMEEEINPFRTVGYFDHFLSASRRVNGMVELCDVTHWIRVNRELLLLTGESCYADRIEEAFYNSFLAGVRKDGRWGAHIIRSHGTNHLWAPPQTGMVEHQCCPDNMMRTFFDVAASTCAAGADKTLSVILYSDADVTLDDASVSIRGGYPWNDGSVSVTVDSQRRRKLRFRAPYWSNEVVINGLAVVAKDGWCEVQAPKGVSEWRLQLDMTPRFYDFHDDLKDIDWYTVMFYENFCDATPNQAGMTRHADAREVMAGPLLLAKGRAAGTSREVTFESLTDLSGGSEARLRMASSGAGLDSASGASVAGGGASSAGSVPLWILSLTDANGSREIPVSCFSAVSNFDDNSNWFSIWF